MDLKDVGMGLVMARESAREISEAFEKTPVSQWRSHKKKRIDEHELSTVLPTYLLLK